MVEFQGDGDDEAAALSGDRVDVAGGLAATLLIGAMAGLYPATKAARLSPTEALQSP